VERYRLTQHIPTKPMYLIMNLAVGGDWPGAPSKYTKFPAYFNIDYVRIYKKQ
jgi:beta-glucanase (GH16 family)